MDQASRRAQTSKGGPRVLTITPNADGSTVTGGIVSNCTKRPLPTNYAVWGESGDQNDYGLLVHGWYVLESDITIFWQQVNPIDALDTDPAATGRKLAAGSCAAFFVDQSTIDGVLVISVCGQDFPGTGLCGTVASPFVPDDFTQGLIRVLRVDTTRLMSETGDSATNMVPPASNACGSAPDVE